MQACDVFIAGAGPAGCASAIALRQAGLSVCIADHKNNLRKVGESLPSATARLLRRLGINDISDLMGKTGFKECIANASAWGTDDWTYIDGLNNPEGGGWHIDRNAFNNSLLEKAIDSGAQYYSAFADIPLKIENEDAKTAPFYIRFRKGGNVTPEGISAKWLIDATGRKSVLGRSLGAVRVKVDEQMAAIVWVNSNKQDTDNATRIKSVAEGWWYTSLLPDGCRVISFHGDAAEVALRTKNTTLFLQNLNATNIIPYSVTEIQVLEKMAADASFTRVNNFAQNGFLCVGDAALSLDPIASQGVFFALYSGIKAAATIVKCCTDTQETSNALAAYKDAVDRVFEANSQSRKYYYSAEIRFKNEPYWQKRSALWL